MHCTTAPGSSTVSYTHLDVYKRQLWWGAALYGYGFAFSVLVTLATALALLDRRLSRLEYETFMLQ